MKKLLFIIALTIMSVSNTMAQNSIEDRYFYDENFDWRWDVRVRISDGLNSGRLTNREARRLYNRLERIERCEYDYQRDGYFSAREQDDIWDDVMDLNQRIGLELNDWDRTYYGYSRPGYAYRGSFNWYDNSYDFYRFDRRGFGSISLGYRPRFFTPRFEHSYGYHRNNYRRNNPNWNRNNGDNNRNDNRRNNDDRRRNNDNRFGSNDRNGSVNSSDRQSRNEREASTRSRERANSSREEIQTPRSYDRPARSSRSESREEIQTPRSYDRPARSSRSETREEIQTPRSNDRPTRSSRSESREEIQTPRASERSSSERSSRGSRDESRGNSRNIRERANDAAPSRGNNN